MLAWRTIREFPNYQISNEGVVLNRNSGVALATRQNQYGVVNVVLHKSGRQYCRSVPKLVAVTFLPSPMREDFSTLIHLNGDRDDFRSDNLAWRPRGFAIEYHWQFEDELETIKQGIIIPVRVVETGEVYPNSWEVAKQYGLLNVNIRRNEVNDRSNWPAGINVSVLPR